MGLVSRLEFWWQTDRINFESKTIGSGKKWDESPSSLSSPYYEIYSTLTGKFNLLLISVLDWPPIKPEPNWRSCKTMKLRFLTVTLLVLALASTVAMTGCKKKEAAPEQAVAPEQAAVVDQAAAPADQAAAPADQAAAAGEHAAEGGEHAAAGEHAAEGGEHAASEHAAEGGEHAAAEHH
jgi:hypothetical protein